MNERDAEKEEHRDKGKESRKIKDSEKLDKEWEKDEADDVEKGVKQNKEENNPQW